LSLVGAAGVLVDMEAAPEQADIALLRRSLFRLAPHIQLLSVLAVLGALR
jgi:hypothetical protein